jgi:hypothetical protein
MIQDFWKIKNGTLKQQIEAIEGKVDSSDWEAIDRITTNTHKKRFWRDTMLSTSRRYSRSFLDRGHDPLKDRRRKFALSADFDLEW